MGLPRPVTVVCRDAPLWSSWLRQAQFTWHDWHRRLHAGAAGLSCLDIGAYRHCLCGYPDGEHHLSPRAVALAEGMSIRATGRLLSID